MLTYPRPALMQKLKGGRSTNGDFLLVSKPSLGRLKTMPTFALEKQMHLQQKQTCFILTLPVAGAVSAQYELILCPFVLYTKGFSIRDIPHTTLEEEEIFISKKTWYRLLRKYCTASLRAPYL